jgi:excisionase family DNA binding protein
VTRLPDPRERPWLTVAEVAEITGEGEKAVRAAIAAGQLPRIDVGRYVRVPTAALWQLCRIPLSEEVTETAGAGPP